MRLFQPNMDRLKRNYIYESSGEAGESGLFLMEGDVVLTKGMGPFSRAINFVLREDGEASSSTHIGGIVESGFAYPAEGVYHAKTLDALASDGVVVRNFSDAYPETSLVAVARAVNISVEQRMRIARVARSYEGRKYGHVKIALHLLGLRRFIEKDKRPICSQVWAKGYSSAGLNFGVKPNKATPDDMSDFIIDGLGKIYRWVIPPNWNYGRETVIEFLVPGYIRSSDADIPSLAS